MSFYQEFVVLIVIYVIRYYKNVYVWKLDKRTQSVLFGHVYLQLFTIQYCSCRLITQHQVRSDLRDGESAAGVLRVHQHKICDNIIIDR